MNINKRSWHSFVSALVLLALSAGSTTSSATEKAYSHSKIKNLLGYKHGSDNFPSTVRKVFSEPQLIPPSNFHVLHVKTTRELEQAVVSANKTGGHTAIYLSKGEYSLLGTLNISADHIWLLSKDKTPYGTTIKGPGMHPTSNVNNLFRVTGNHFVLDGLTLSDSPNHLIQIAGESGASHPTIRNSILQDSYEQMLKVSYNLKHKPHVFSSNGLVEHSVFQYTQDIAPNYYTGGIDALGAQHWVVRKNVFRDIASPAKHIAQHAVHFWVNSAHNQVIDNLFIDNDRAIGFGMPLSKHKNRVTHSNLAGLIKGNVIYHSNNGDPFADTGIVLEASPQTQIKSNLIYLEHNYPRAIEYRFPETKGVWIEGNRGNKMISSRNGGEATLLNNEIRHEASEFTRALQSTLERLGITALYHPVTATIYHQK